NFAWSTSPDYHYLGGRWRGKPIHLLWQPGSERWDAAGVLDRQKDALAWIEELFGEYPWPQITVTDRIEGGATEFPMLYMTSGGAVVHETMHMVAHGILANNEWREGWLDEGMASFLTSWLREEEGASPRDVWERPTATVGIRDRTGRSEPVGLPGAEFSSYRMYSTMTYTKGSVVLRMLRDLLGEETFRRGLRAYYERFRFRQVTGEDFRDVMTEVSGRELDWFFDQWLHTTDWLDYRVGAVEVSGTGGRHTLRVEVIREGPAWMPVVVEAAGRRITLDGRARTQTATLSLDRRPETIVVDPDAALPDPDRQNNLRPVP
nr:hypothetical protein [Gemmatimonadota bacterium]NIQ56762.1 hypothetical protein [Gemmatimonadota bacterium]NIU76943.1 hypothetical protein [Gammaproteobacteria bacterium]NIX46310.1 hypothetical protein [Gemmatimonadota bacterium]NIY10637.1 hypothetical protein [Gemmatimonadota bacterium]